jgi:hypothetical protein
MAAAWLGAALFGSRAALAANPPPGPPAADVQGVRVDQLQPASPESTFFRAEGPHNPAAEGVEFAAGVTFEYGNGVLREVDVDTTGGKTLSSTVVSNLLLARVSASITPLHWLAFDVSIPFALFESGDSPKGYASQPPPTVSSAGVGDLRLGVHFRPIDTKAFGLILGGRAWAPFGTPFDSLSSDKKTLVSSYLSDHRFRAEVDIGVAGERPSVLWGCTVNLAPTFFARRDGDRMALGCAAHYVVSPLVSIGLEPSFELVTHDVPSASDPTKTSATLGILVEPLAALRLRFASGFRLGLAAGPGFGGGQGSADVRGMINLAYVGLGKPPKPPPPAGPPDRDLDKIPDDQDACPDEAGPPSPNPKLNGCPAHDRDGDGIRDEDDACPDQPGIAYPDPKANGCPDSDNDGLPDPIDQCVHEPGPPPTGCPQHARLGADGFKIDPPIDFGTSDKLRADGRAALEEVAATLRANPKIEQISISIGTKGAKAPLSDKRAQEVLGVLRGGGLDSNRYEVVLREDMKAGQVQVRIVK